MKNLFITLMSITITTAFSLASEKLSPEALPKFKISEKAAQEIATRRRPGEVKSSELEKEEGKWVYSFDIFSKKDSLIHEIWVDPKTGKIMKDTTESPQEEAKEHKVDPN